MFVIGSADERLQYTGQTQNEGEMVIAATNKDAKHTASRSPPAGSTSFRHGRSLSSSNHAFVNKYTNHEHAGHPPTPYGLH